MRDDVLIILNEREPLKQQMAAMLAEQLSGRNLSHERLKPVPNLAKIILERKPRLLILDYLLGDEATALDILGRLEEQEEKDLIRTIIWTDESSVSVAVSAMKLGACDYIELGSPKDLEKLLIAIDENLVVPQDHGAKNRMKRLRKEQELPVYESPTSRLTLTQAIAAANRNSPIVVLHGEPGIGRSTLARFIHHTRRRAGSFFEIVLENWAGPAEDIFGGSESLWHPRALSSAATVCLEHAEFDVNELLEQADHQRAKIWGQNPAEEQPMLIVGTASQDVALAWKRLLDAEIISLPSLKDRTGDFLPLLQRFAAEARQLGPVNRLDITSELIDQLAKLDWPGNIKQLRATLIDTLTTPLANIREQYSNTEISQSKSSHKTSDDFDMLMTYLLDMKARFETSALPSQTVPSALAVRKAIDESGGNYRIAAVRLGVGVPQIRAALRDVAGTQA